ncbi:flagellar hook-length control protein FliK [Xenorhabdus sp. PB61.4]|uniref:flagellar hook-length control protein FliK n=1 Tax=Xenorhabdus sp. PB61.4 TaxID=2788940 RepID=UPI001E30B459|nr:flagellar hook-length control protein FliK [Xenorhabdus sp. PB61.4]MCC8366827.1 flagellar hook-length control protein FliK [Xenorhabdus sp. PB61.4]
MNLTLLPTDLTLEKSVGKNQQALNSSPGSNAPKEQVTEFGQILSAEQKNSVQTAKNRTDGSNSESGEKYSTDNRDEEKLSSSLAVAGQVAILDKSSASGFSASGNDAEFTLSEEDDPLSAEMLINAMPIQLAGLINHRPAGEGSESSDDLLSTENSLEDTLSDRKLAGKKTKADIALVATDPAEENDLDSDIRSFTTQQTASATNRAALAPATGKVKATANGTEQNSESSVSGKGDIGKAFLSTQGATALASASVETSSSNTLHNLFSAPLLTTGHQANGQIQLNNAPAPFLSAHLGSEEWQQQLNQQVLFFNRNGLQQAELRLHPQELGALHIRMNVEDNQAQLHFVSAHQHVRAALEAALPNLRLSLAENGIQLAESSVGSDTSGNWQQEQAADPQQHANTGSHTENHRALAATQAPATHESTIRLTPQQLASSRGGVDIFA